MVTLLLDSTRLEVVLSGAERVLSFHKGNVIIERSTISKVQLVDDAWTWLRGVRSPGTHVPGVIAMGTWRSNGATDFAIIRRGRPAVVIDLVGHPGFDRVILSTSHGLELVRALRLDDVSSEPADVVDIAAETATITTPEKARSTRTRPRPAPAT